MKRFLMFLLVFSMTSTTIFAVNFYEKIEKKAKNIAQLEKIVHQVKEKEYAENYRKYKLFTVMKTLGCPVNKIAGFSKAIMMAVDTTNHPKINDILIASLMKTESNFVVNAKSNKGYKGLLQVPFMTDFAELDILHGVLILKQKLVVSKGDLSLALAFYKGGRSPMAVRQSKEVIALYKSVK